VAHLVHIVHINHQCKLGDNRMHSLARRLQLAPKCFKCGEPGHRMAEKYDKILLIESGRRWTIQRVCLRKMMNLMTVRKLMRKLSLGMNVLCVVRRVCLTPRKMGGSTTSSNLHVPWEEM
jgi:hypothetical protein